MLSKDLERVKVSQVIESQLPNFILGENSLFTEFLKQYYIQQETITDLSENIDRIVNLENFDITRFTEYTTSLTNNITYYDDEIEVESTASWPDRYGLLQIDGEIITYTSKDETHFYGAIRGFSGIESLQNNYGENELVFSRTESDSHNAQARVKNLSNLVYVEIWNKIKSQFLPGFENKKINEGVNKKLFLTRIKDFYDSKGSEESFKILFKALYGDTNLKVVRPSDYVIRPSSAEWSVTNNLIVEPISGDITKISGYPIVQDSPYAYGNVYLSTLISIDEQIYYEIQLSNDTKIGTFKACPTTKTILPAAAGSKTIFVDSTIGFPNTGELYIDGNYIAYDGKNDNQFLNCNIPFNVSKFISVYQNSFAYSFEDGDESRPVYMRISSVISNTSNIVEDSKYLKVGDEIGVKSLGEDIETDIEIYDNRISNWLQNNTYQVDVVRKPNGIPITQSPATINTKNDHGLRVDDLVTLYDIDDFDNSFNVPVNGRVVQVISPRSFAFEYSGGVLDSNLDYKLIKDLKVTEVDGNTYITDIQNTYVNERKNFVYVTSSGLPSYNIKTQLDKVYFSIGTFPTSSITSVNLSGLTINHNFETGDKVFYDYTGQNIGINTGSYFVKKISPTEIKLAYNRAKLFQEDYIQFLPASSSITNSLILDSVSNREITDQKLIKRIAVEPKLKNNVYSVKTSPLLTSVGILLNGTEIIYNRSDDRVYYGKITSIDVLNGGSNYNLLEPPTVFIEDSVGVGATGFVHLEGGLHEVKVLSPGFDYDKPPSITISGGNGTGAVAEPILKEIFTSINFSGNYVGINTVSNEIGFGTFHNFKTGEPLIYRAFNNLALGIGTDGAPAAGNPDTTEYLVDFSKYYAIRVNDTTIKIANTEETAFANAEINITSLGKGNHSFTSARPRKVVDRVIVTNSGSGYVNKKVQVTSEKYPPKEPQNLSIALVGINTQENYIYAKNHNFSNKELVYYSTTGTVIVGLNTNHQYYVIPLDNDKFRLTFAGTGIGTAISDNYDQNKYVKFENNGAGLHTFYTPPIKFEVTGVPKSQDVIGSGSVIGDNVENSQAVFLPVFSGGVTNLFLTNGGSNYGTSEILNYNRTPNVTLSSGKDAILQPIIIDDKIDEVYILSGGSGYTSVPEIKVFGDGEYASLLPVIKNGRIVAVEVINPGKNYNKNNTELTVVIRGSNARFTANLQTWHVNLYKRYESVINDSTNISNSFYIRSFNKNVDSAQLVSVTVPKKLRQLLGDNLDANLNTVPNIKHSPIVGWAYDGNPIFGNYGSTNTKSISPVRELRSGYELLPLPERPAYPPGFFIEDYVYTANGDLDEYNGRYCVTPEFPDGTYAYFSTGSNYPYILNDYAFEVDNFNLDSRNIQTANIIEKENLIRNITPYKLTKEYISYDGINLKYSTGVKTLVRAVHKSGIDDIDVVSGGSNYKVNDRLNFNNTNTNGRGLSAKISSIVGAAISTVSNVVTTINDVEFIKQEKDIVGIFTSPQFITNQQILTITGINTSTYKFIEGKYAVGVVSSFSNLTVALAATSTTGITTGVFLSQPPNSRVINANDVIGIGSERLLVLGYNKFNTGYTVLRGYNSTVGSSHTSGSLVTLYPRIFSVPVKGGISTESTTNINYVKFFNPQTDVGIGTLRNTIEVGFGATAEPIGIQTNQGAYTKFEFYRNPFKIGDIIKTEHITNLGIGSATVVSSDARFITIAYNSSSLPSPVGLGSTSLITQIRRVDVNEGSIYVPKHGFKTGQQIKYEAITGIGLTYSPNKTFATTRILTSGSIVYAIYDDTDYIGISTRRVGVTSSQDRIYFPQIDPSNGVAHKFSTTFNNPIGQVVLNEAVVTTSSNHNLSQGDFIEFALTPNQVGIVTVKFDDISARLLVNPTTFNSSAISVVNNNITIPNNTFKTGDKVVYTASNPALPLKTGEEYFVIVENTNRIKLTEYLYDAKNNQFTSEINLTSAGSGTHTLSLINPPLKFTLGDRIDFDIKDQSLNSLVLDFYRDDTFTNKISQKNISRIGIPGDQNNTTKVSVVLDTDVPEVFYYKLVPVGISTITSNAYAYNVDTDVQGFSRIQVVPSEYNGEYRLTSVGSTTFKFDLLKEPERSFYSNSGISTFRYTTDSRTAFGSINEVSIGFTGTGYLSLPDVSTITTENGADAILKPFSYDIGKIKNITISNSGYNFPTDPSIRPKADVPFVVKLTDNNRLNEVVVLDGGKNYLVEPRLICLEHPEIVFDAELENNSVSSVSILVNKTGLSEVSPTIIPVNNSNGVRVLDAYSDGFTNTLKIRPPSGKFIQFPFEVGDKIFVEGIELNEPLAGFGGYNSEDYNYTYFTVTATDDTPGDETVSYSIVGLGSTGGYFNEANSTGRVINYDDLAKFTATTEITDFIENETITTNDARFKVYRDGWNRDKSILKLSGNSFNISVGSTIVGAKSNSRGTVEEIDITNTFYGCSGEYVKENGWKTRVGFTNDIDHRIQDSAYYQNFSYALNSFVQKSDWDSDVDSLAHPSGFEVFGDVVIASKSSDNLRVQTTPSFETVINILSLGSFNTLQYFDRVFEITTNKGISKQISFLTKKLIDYTICKTNRVLDVDDISPQFNGTSVLEVNGRYADAADLILLNREFIQSEVVGFITSTYSAILSNPDFDSEVCARDVGYVVDAISYDLKYGGNERSVAAGLAYWTGVGGTSFVDGESNETIGGFRYIIDLSKYVINNVAISTSYQSNPFDIQQSFNFNVLTDDECSPSYSENCCANVVSAIGSYVGIITSIIGIGTTAAPNVTESPVSKGGKVVGLSSFFLNYKGSRIISSAFTPQLACAIGSSIITLPNHTFSTGEEVLYDPGNGGTGIAIESTNRVIGGATTDFMPNRVFVYKIDTNRIKIAGLSTDAKSNGNFFIFRNLGGGIGPGAGTTHKLYPPYDAANAKSLISIDNIIQTPIRRDKVSTALAEPISIGATVVALTGITSITSSNFLRVDDEIMEIKVVGFGSTNVLSVGRGYMGTVAVAHTVGAGVTVMSGNYNIVNGTIYFASPPYGDVGLVGLSTRSSFAGRVFFRLNYDSNYVFDNITQEFNGSSNKFELTSYGSDVTGIITDIGNNIVGPNYGIISINNVLQIPVKDYTMTERAAIGIGGSIAFTGTDVNDLPKGGVINNTIAGFGSGYQPLVPAFALPVVSGSGTIQSLVLTSAGSGYRSNVEVKVNSSVGSGASIVALVGTGSSVGIITGFNIISGGSGYASTQPPTIYVGIPTAYSNIPVIGGSGSGAKVNIIVGSGGSVTQYEFSNRGIGYLVNDVLTVSGIPTQIGIGTSAFTLTVLDTVNDKFSGWHFGNLTLLDDISLEFNGRSRSFLITKTDIITERYNISALPGSNIDVQNNLIIILDGVLQQPKKDYTLVGGERIVFSDPPSPGDQCLIFFYRGSAADVLDINVIPQVKPGDTVNLLKNPPYVTQLDRVVTEIESISQIRTTNYIDVGISTDPTIYRVLNLNKQKSDLVIDNVYISKARPISEGNFIPTTRIIKNVGTEDSAIYVESAYPAFKQLDDILQIRNSVILFNEKETNTAKITATVSAAGTVTDFEVLDSGFGYDSIPDATISSTKELIPQYGKEWIINPIKVGIDQYNDFDFGDGFYVASSNNGGISTSRDFVNWSDQPTITALDLNGVAYGNNGWVIVGSSATTFSSVNGKNWNSNATFLSRVFVGGVIPFNYPPASYTGNINGVDFSNNRFVAVGAGGTALVSEVSTGISTSWVVRSTTTSQDLNAVAAGFDNYVAVGNNGAITRSTDGYVWTTHNSNTSNNLLSVKFLNNTYFAVGINGTILNSNDGGGTWNNVSDPTFASYDLYDIEYKNNVYLISGTLQLTLVSSDGDNWIRTTNSGMDIIKLGTNEVNIIGVGQSSQYATTDAQKVKATIGVTVSLGGTVTGVNVIDPGFGYDENTPVVVLVSPPVTYKETLDNVNVIGDYGNVKSISTNLTGISTSSPMVIFEFDCDDILNLPEYGGLERSGISTGDYFVIKGSIVGAGITTLDSTNGFGILGIGTEYIDNVYRADNIQRSVSGIVTVFSNVESVVGISTTSGFTCAKYSWGKLFEFNSRAEPRTFTLSNTGLTGISTAPLVYRRSPLSANY